MGDSNDDMFLIWSEEHRGWWRARECGYTTSIEEAGRYPRRRATQIVRNANIQALHEVMLRAPIARDGTDG